MRLKYVLIFLSAILVHSTAFAGFDPSSWLSKEVANADQSMTVEGSQDWNGGTAGKLYGKKVVIRNKTSVHRPFTAQAPRLNVGCGGIDTFMGGFESVADADWVQSRAQGVINAAPYAAFEIGLKTYCPTCLETIRSVQAIIDKINAISLDECAAAKAVVALSADKLSGSEQGAEHYTNYMESAGLTGWFGETKGELEDQRDMKKASEGCSGIVQDLRTDGTHSIMKVMADKVGMEAQNVLIFRALLGDITYNIGGGTYHHVPACYSQQEALEVFRDDSGNPTVWEITEANQPPCNATFTMSLSQQIYNQIEEIIRAMKDKDNINAASTALITTMNPGINQLVEYGVLAGQESDFFADIIDIMRLQLMINMLSEVSTIGKKIDEAIKAEQKNQDKKDNCFSAVVYTELKGMLEEQIVPNAEFLLETGQELMKEKQQIQAEILAKIKDMEEIRKLEEEKQKLQLAKEVLQGQVGK